MIYVSSLIIFKAIIDILNITLLIFVGDTALMASMNNIEVIDLNVDDIVEKSITSPISEIACEFINLILIIFCTVILI